MLRSQGINATHGITTTEHNMYIKFSYKQLITFGIPQCCPAATAKQILIRFWQVIQKQDRQAKGMGCSRYVHAKTIECLSTQAAA